MRRSRRSITAALLLSTALIVVGCSASSDIDAQTSADWQARVVSIGEFAAASDPATALQELAALETEAREARSAGEIGAQRAAAIEQAIALVRADLQAASTPQDTPDPSVAPSVDDGSESTVDDGTSANNGNSGNNGNGNKGNGNKGNGKGNDD